MKCKNCGASLNLEDAYCKYCGAPNDLAKEHIRDMSQYKKEFEQTKSDVQRKTNITASISVRVVILVVLIVLIFIVALLYGQSYSLFRWKQQRYAEKHVDEISAQLDTYLEEGEFEKFYGTLRTYYLTSTMDTPYDKYSNLAQTASRYHYLLDECRSIASPDPYDNAYQSYKELSESVNSFYKRDYPETMQYPDMLSENDITYIREMHEEIKALLVTYVGLTAEEADSLKDLSEAERTMLIVGKYHDNENENSKTDESFNAE